MRKATKRGRRGRAGFSGGSRSPSGFPRRGLAPELAPVARDLRDDLVREVALVAAVARGGAGASARAAPGAFPARPAGRGRGRGRIGKRVAANMLERRRRRALPTRARSGSRRAENLEARTGEGARGPAGARARACRCGRARIDPPGASAEVRFLVRARARRGRARPDVEKISESASAKIPTRISPRSRRDRVKKVSNMKVRGDSREPILVSILKKSPSRVSFSSSFWVVSSTLKTPKSPHTLEPLDYVHGPSGCSRAYLSTMLLSVAL